MPIEEVFPCPTVKQVHFEIRFPNLFYLESRVGEFQIKIMRTFPESALVLRKQFLLARHDEGTPAEIPQPEMAQKIWTFNNSNGVSISLASNSMVISSDRHMTYKMGGSDRFRDVIELACTSFLCVTNVPLLARVGLRYVNACPLPERSTAALTSYLDTALPMSKFPLESASGMQFVAVVKRGSADLRYVESIREEAGSTFVDLDFDASEENVEAEQLLPKADALHDVISSEFDRVARPLLKQFMRQDKG